MPERDARLAQRLRGTLVQTRRYLTRGIWEMSGGRQSRLEERGKALLRVLVLAWQGLERNGLFSRAGALSYATLMGLGPLIAISVILSTAFIHTDAETQVKRALMFIAPSLQEYVDLEKSQPGAEGSGEQIVTALDTLISQIVSGAEATLHRVNVSGSTVFTSAGSIIFIFIIIQLMTSIETTLNQIWGVRRGRSWGQRIVTYWAFVSLGVLLGVGGTAMFSASNIAVNFDWMPYGGQLSHLLIAIGGPLLSYLMLTLLLSLFYMYFPHTMVQYQAALIGGMLTAALLILNNYLSILYIHKVVSLQSLFGSLGILPVLMFGLYFFWVCILLGGQITFAVQNAHVLTKQSVWNQLSASARELITLSAMIEIGRQYLDCKPPLTAEELGNRLEVPVNIINESLHLLDEFDWVVQVRSESGADATLEATSWQPARPLSTLTLEQFHGLMAGAGRDEGIPELKNRDPLLDRYARALQAPLGDSCMTLPLDACLRSA
jgi:membrane protein